MLIGRFTCFIHHVGIGTIFNQQAGDFRGSQFSRRHQRCPSLDVADIGVHASPYEYADHVCATFEHGIEQSGSRHLLTGAVCVHHFAIG